MNPAALRRLQSLTEARRAAALARLETLQLEDRRIAEVIIELAAMPAREIAETPEGLPHYARRLAWVGHRIAVLERRRSALAVEIAAARAAAGSSVGRHEAMGALIRRADRSAADLREARAEREAPSPLGQADPAPPPAKRH